jgi:hypothetical protein
MIARVHVGVPFLLAVPEGLPLPGWAHVISLRRPGPTAIAEPRFQSRPHLLPLVPR